MSHELEITDGKARFAYANSADPWHLLGEPMEGLQTLEAMLEASKSDYEVFTSGVIAADLETGEPLRNPDGSFVWINDSRATVRKDVDGSLGGLATVGTRFNPQQNRIVAERALAIVQYAGILGTDAVFDTMGVMFDGRRFFALIDLGAITLDIGGIADKITRYLFVAQGHDGKLPETYGCTNIRIVCNNTCTAALQTARMFKARHTVGNKELDMKEAARILGLESRWAAEFEKMANTMLAIDLSTKYNPIDRVMATVFPIADDATDRQVENRDEKVALIRGLFDGPKNAGSFGNNGWSLWNAIVEFLDHHREGDEQSRAITSMDDTSWVTKTKFAAQNAVLALV